MPSYTTTQLISKIKTGGMIPTSQGTFTDARFVEMLNRELSEVIIPSIREVREEYFVSFSDVTIISGQKKYDIPTRAIGASLRDVLFVDSNGQELRSLPLLDVDQLTSPVNSFVGRRREGFFLESNKVVLTELPNTGELLRLKFYQRPNQLVEITSCSQITSIDNATDVTISGTTSLTTGDIVDVIQDQPHFNSLDIDQTITVVGSTITFTAVPSDTVVGDWICLAGESPVPQIPVEYHNVLVQSVIVKILEALGDFDGMEAAEAKLRQIKNSALSLITPRVTGEPKKIVNLWSPLRIQ